MKVPDIFVLILWMHCEEYKRSFPNSFGGGSFSDLQYFLLTNDFWKVGEKQSKSLAQVGNNAKTNCLSLCVEGWHKSTRCSMIKCLYFNVVWFCVADYLVIIEWITRLC